MTIRDYIKRRVSWAFFAFFAGAAVSMLLPLIGGKQLAAAIGLIVGVAAMLGYFSMLFIRCPRCRAFISTSIAFPTAFRLFGRKVQYCPYCAVNLDEPMPETKDGRGR
jgi:hypothetical protein